jgi:hypothetical protein
MHHDAQRPKIEVVGPQQPDLAGAQPVAIGDQKQCAVARTGRTTANSRASSSRVRNLMVSVGERAIPAE